MKYIRIISTFVVRLTKHFIEMIVNKDVDYSFEFKIICLPCLYPYSTLGGFSLLNKILFEHRIQPLFRFTQIQYMGIPSVDGKYDTLIKWEEQDLWR